MKIDTFQRCMDYVDIAGRSSARSNLVSCVQYTKAIGLFCSHHRYIRLESKFLAPKIDIAESEVDDEFAEGAAVIATGIVAKDIKGINHK